jgi:PhzF family phenazine biosynthesis protein
MEQYYRMRVFPKSYHGGDRVGIYLFSDNLDTNEIEEIADESDYIKNGFVSSSDIADIKIELVNKAFTNNYCGNTVVCALSLLRDLNYISKGLVFYEYNNHVYSAIVQDDEVFVEFKYPIFYDYVPNEEIMKCFKGVSFHKKLKPQIIQIQDRNLIVPITSIDALNELMPNESEIIKLSKKYNLKSIHTFSFTSSFSKEIYGRNFTFTSKINEQPVTTTSNGALACYLYKHYKKKKNITLRQGYSIEQPSELHVRIHSNKNEISSIWVGGPAYLIKESPLKILNLN